MITENEVITNALLRLGEIGSYNDTRSSIYARAEFLLGGVLNYVAKDGAFLFNAVTTTLTATGNFSDMEEYQFNRPIDMLNFINIFPKKNGRLEGEYFYSDVEEIQLRYLRKLNLSDYPDYMREYLIFALAQNIAEVHNSYATKLDYINLALKNEETKILGNEGFDFHIDEDLDGVVF